MRAFFHSRNHGIEFLACWYKCFDIVILHLPYCVLCSQKMDCMYFKWFCLFGINISRGCITRLWEWEWYNQSLVFTSMMHCALLHYCILFIIKVIMICFRCSLYDWYFVSCKQNCRHSVAEPGIQNRWGHFDIFRQKKPWQAKKGPLRCF